MKKDFYEILGISKNADAAEIKKAYRKQAIAHHPDKNPGCESCSEKFKLIALIFMFLGILLIIINSLFLLIWQCYRTTCICR